MAAQTLLVDHQIGSAVIDGIRAARREVVIVSPYVQLWTNLDRELSNAKQRGLKLRLFYRTDSEKKLDKTRLTQLFNELIPVDLLHAKIYGFDDEYIVSSMNLYNFSQESSREIALRVTDTGQCEEIRRYVAEQLTPQRATPPSAADLIGQMDPAKMMLKLLELVGGHAESPSQQPIVAPQRGSIPASPSKKPSSAKRAEGFCIRCGDGLALNPEKPLCGGCYKEWAKFKNPQYEERQCHLCGKPNRTSVLKPLCYGCYKKVMA